MKRAGIAIVLLLAMLWQSVIPAQAGSMLGEVAGPGHAALHWQEEGHHHHDDGSFHLDDSEESARHLLADHVTPSFGLPHEVLVAVPAFVAVAPGLLCEQTPPHPFLAGPLKPPRLTA